MQNLSFVIGLVLAQISLASAQDKSIVVASTTSTQDSGLYGFILPLFKQKTGIDVKVVAQGTGQALDTARRGDADVVLVHAKQAEEKFIAEGFGVKRYSVMYNDFIIIGPRCWKRLPIRSRSSDGRVRKELAARVILRVDYPQRGWDSLRFMHRLRTIWNHQSWA